MVHRLDVLKRAGKSARTLAKALDETVPLERMGQARAAAKCRRCELGVERENNPWSNVVFGVGPSPATVLVVGEGPGHQEDRTGVPFVGAAGQLLDRTLAQVGMDRGEVAITNVVRCRPPGNRTPKPDEVEACSVWTKLIIERVDPEVILCLGATALSYFALGEKISDRRGQPFVWQGRLVFPTYHPAAALRTADRFNVFRDDMELFAKVVADVRGVLSSPMAGTLLRLWDMWEIPLPAIRVHAGKRYVFLPTDMEVTRRDGDIIVTPGMVDGYEGTMVDLLAELVALDRELEGVT